MTLCVEDSKESSCPTFIIELQTVCEIRAFWIDCLTLENSGTISQGHSLNMPKEMNPQRPRYIYPKPPKTVVAYTHPQNWNNFINIATRW